MHGHGGILLEHVKQLAFFMDIGPGDRFFWFSTTGWMMWNLLVSGLAVGSALVLFDGDLGSPDLMMLWRLAEETEMTYFGASAPFLLACRKAGLEPAKVCDLSRLRGIGSTGAPLPPEGFRWVYEAVTTDAQLNSISGGTDVCAAFVGACPLLPVLEGRISGRLLGAKVEAFDPDGRPVVGEQGELVITEPMPSMPVGFWGDTDGSRYRSAYFDDFPGVWRHGDWIVFDDDGSCVISGRSDSTLNRGGVRLGTSEFYSVVEGFAEVGRQSRRPPRGPVRSTASGWASCCCSSFRPRAAPSTTISRPGSLRSCAGRCHPATSPTAFMQFLEYLGRCRGRSWKYQ